MYAVIAHNETLESSNNDTVTEYRLGQHRWTFELLALFAREPGVTIGCQL